MKLKRLFASMAAVAMAFSMASVALAEEPEGGEPAAPSKPGKITITNASYGEEYTLYKIFDAEVGEGDAVAYKLMDGKTEAPAGFTANANGYITEAPDTLDEEVDWTDYGVQVGETVTADGDAIEFDNLDDGYYYITTSLGTLVTVDKAVHEVNVVDKNSTDPTIPDDGKTAKVDGTAVSATDNDVAIGDTVNYTLKLNATNYNANNDKIYQYTFVDTSASLLVDLDSVVVKVDGAAFEETKLADGVEISTSYANGVLTVIVPWTDDQTADGTSLYPNGSVITVDYTAEVIAVDSATNSYEGSYNTTSMGDKSVTVYNYKFTVNKVDENDNALTGAEFSLWTAATGGEQIALVKVQDGTYRVATTADKTDPGFKSAPIEAGSAVVEGLANGTYYLQEDKAPAGYNQLVGREGVEIDLAGAQTTDIIIGVVNEAGATLPSTGGMGTTLFYVVGGALVAGAGILLITKKRVSAEQ